MTRIRPNKRNPEDNPAYLHDHYQDDTKVQDSVNSISGTMPQPPGMEHEVELIAKERSELLEAVRSLERMLTSTGRSAIRTTEAGGEIVMKSFAVGDVPIKLCSYNYNRSRIIIMGAPDIQHLGIGTDQSISFFGASPTPAANTFDASGIMLSYGPGLVLTTVRDLWAVQPLLAPVKYISVIEEFMAPQDR